MELFETPPPEPTRRNTRRALAEIPESVLYNQGLTGRSTRTPINTVIPYVTPSPSPDELVIQARGRRHIPDTWSPPVSPYRNRSPNKDPTSPPNLRYSPRYRNRSPNHEATPNKIDSPIVTRSTPRKRLLMGDASPDNLSSSPECKCLSPLLKKMKLETPLQDESSPDLKLKALSREQLIEVIEGLARKHAIVKEELKHSLPIPDLRLITDELYELKRNIYKCLPTSRLLSKSDGAAYRRAATHVHAFKKAVLKAGQTYMESQDWDTVLRYAMMAWGQTMSTPLWDNCPHNASRRQCYRYLSGMMQQALKKIGKFPEEEIESLEMKFKRFTSEGEDILPCLKLLEELRA